MFFVLEWVGLCVMIDILQFWQYPCSPSRIRIAKWTKITVKMHIGRVLCVHKWYILHFLQLLLCCAGNLLEKYPVWQLTMPSCLVVKENFPNTNILVNYHIMIICNWPGYDYSNFCFNWQTFTRCLAYNMKWITIPNTLFEKSIHIPVIFW